MKEFNPQPTRLLLPTADELSDNMKHFVPYPLAEDNERLGTIKGKKGTRIPSDEIAATLLCKQALLQASTPEQASELGHYFAAAAFGGAKYLLADQQTSATSSTPPPKPRQNRYGSVPLLAAPNPADRPSTEELRDRAVASLETTLGYFSMRFSASKFSRSSERLALETGRSLLRTASALAVIGLGDTVADPGNYITDHDAQLMSRDACMKAINASTDASIETGTHSSFIQLVSTKSPFAVELQRAATPEVERLYLMAQQAA